MDSNLSSYDGDRDSRMPAVTKELPIKYRYLLEDLIVYEYTAYKKKKM
jgi:hypothetical protein